MVPSTSKATGAAATREAVAAAMAAAASRVARGSGAAPARNPLQVRFVLNPWQTASILHHSMSNEATQLELALLAPHMADMVAPLVQDPLRLHFNPVGILHGNSKNNCEFANSSLDVLLFVLLLNVSNLVCTTIIFSSH